VRIDIYVDGKRRHQRVSNLLDGLHPSWGLRCGKLNERPKAGDTIRVGPRYYRVVLVREQDKDGVVGVDVEVSQ